jgi:predicted RNA-binding protein YlqC (UPF0109 family)
VKDLLAYLARNLVEDREAVRIRETASEKGRSFLLEVAPSDRGHVIGRQGATVNAVRALLTAAARRRGEPPVRLDVAD